MGIIFHLKLGKGIVVLLLCSVPDHTDFAIIERLSKFNCSSPFRYFFRLLLNRIFRSKVRNLCLLNMVSLWLSDINLKKKLIEV